MTERDKAISRLLNHIYMLNEYRIDIDGNMDYKEWIKTNRDPSAVMNKYRIEECEDEIEDLLLSIELRLRKCMEWFKEENNECE